MQKVCFSNAALFCLLSATCHTACAEFADVLTPSPASSTQAVRTRAGEDNHKVISEKSSTEFKAQESRFVWPVEGRVSSPFGMRRGREHDGIDISAPRGTPVCAASDGKVIFSGRINGYGNIIILKHGGNYFTAYAHLSQTGVSKGDKVRQGKVIGRVGRSGRASSPHLHFEIRKKTTAYDPLRILPDR